MHGRKFHFPGNEWLLNETILFNRRTHQQQQQWQQLQSMAIIKEKRRRGRVRETTIVGWQKWGEQFFREDSSEFG